MRFAILLAAGLLASCATPKTAPQSYYGETYVQGGVTVEKDGRYVSKMAVFKEQDLANARLAAYSRLLQTAQGSGYTSFDIQDERSFERLGFGYEVTGTLYKDRAPGKGIYAISAIERLLNGLPLEEPKPVYKPKPKPVKLASKIAPKTRVKSTVKSTVKKIEPVATAPVQPIEEPTVILAPTDITGSIKPVIAAPGETRSSINPAKAVSNEVTGSIKPVNVAPAIVSPAPAPIKTSINATPAITLKTEVPASLVSTPPGVKLVTSPQRSGAGR